MNARHVPAQASGVGATYVPGRATVVVPALDEERSISACIESVLAQTHRDLEVLVVDGGSTDRTRRLVGAFAAADPRVQLLDNPDRIPSAALNVALEAMTGEHLVRVDAHSSIAPDYVARALAHLSTGPWGGVGGRKDAVSGTTVGRAIAAALGSPFGVGNSTYHHGTEAGPVDHIPFGAYPREVVDAVGGWDATIAVNEDYEFDYRVRASGRPLLFDPALRIAWECRDDLSGLRRQYIRYGRGKAAVIRRHPRSTSPRHLAAPALVALLVGALLLLPRRPRWALRLVAPYAVALAAASAATAAGVAKESRRHLPAVFATMHLAWGLGFWEGLAGIKPTWGRGSRRV